MSAIVTFTELQSLTGYSRVGDVEKCLRKNGIRFLYGRNGIVYTTINALDSSMGLQSGKILEKEQDIDIL